MIDVVGKLWGFCHTLRHDGVDYGDYIEQITYLLVPQDGRGARLNLKRVPTEGRTRQTSSLRLLLASAAGSIGTDLTDHYAKVLVLGRQRGYLGEIFTRGAVSVQRSGEPQATHQPDRRNRVDRASTRTSRPTPTRGCWRRPRARGRRGPGNTSPRGCSSRSIVACMKPDPRAHTDVHRCRSCLRNGRVPGRRVRVVQRLGEGRRWIATSPSG